MSPGSVLRALARLLAGVVLIASGVYILVYLWRWEWQRAIISGVFFLAALVVVSTLVVLRSVALLSRKVERLETSGTGPARPVDAAATSSTAATLRRSSADHATRHFDWLTEAPDRLGVFVPILLGAGALLSGVAYLIERLAGAVASSTVDRSAVALLAPDLPLGGTEERAPASAPARPHGARRTVASVAIVGAVAATIAGTVVLLMLLTQTRADYPVEGDTTVIELRLDQRGREQRPADQLATALWVACRSRLSTDVSLGSAVATGPSGAVMVLDAPLGEFARRRVVGCLEDATLDRMQATVVEVGIGRAEPVQD